MVGVLSSQWGQRQFLLAVNRRDVDSVRHLLAARSSPSECGEGGLGKIPSCRSHQSTHRVQRQRGVPGRPEQLSCVEDMKKRAPKLSLQRADAQIFRPFRKLFGVVRGVCAVRLGGREFFVNTWESIANAKMHMLYLTGYAALPWSMRELALDVVVSDWCSRHGLRVCLW